MEYHDRSVTSVKSLIKDEAGKSTATKSITYDAFVSYSHAADFSTASVVQKGLQRVAKPWYKRVSIRVFLDESNLAATPALWTKIAQAIDASGAFILMASPQAAQSRWVAQEVAHWRESNSMERFFIVLTDGNLVWDDNLGDFDRSITNCLPSVLEGAFSDEPLYVDLRFLHTEKTSDLRNPRLRTSLARLAAPLRGLALDDLISEDLRLHRRAIRLAWSAVSALVILTLAAVLFGLLALQSSKEAERKARSANARRLALQSFVSDQIEQKIDLGVLLALQSIRLESNASAYRSLLLSMSALNDLEVYLWAPDQKLNSVTFSPEGKSISALSQDDTVLTWDLEKPLRNQIPNDKGFHKVNELSISDSGSEVLVAFEGGDIVIDRQSSVLARTGSAGVDILEIEGQHLITIPVSPNDTTALALSLGGKVLATGSKSGLVNLWDTRNGIRLHQGLMLPEPIDAGLDVRVTALALSPDARNLAVGYGDQSLWLWNLESKKPEAQLIEKLYSEVNRIVIDHSGSQILAAYGRHVKLWNLYYGSSKQLLGSGYLIQDVALSPDGERIAGVSSEAVLIWNVKDHEALSRSLQELHDASVVAVATNPDGDAARSLDYNGLLVTADVGSQPFTYQYLQVPTTAGSLAVFSKDGRHLVTLEEDGDILAHWDLKSTAPVLASQITLPSQGTGLTLSQDGGHAAVALSGGGIAVYTIEPNSITFQWQTDTNEWIFTVALSKDGKWLAGAYEDMGFFVRNMQSGSETVVPGGHDGTVTGLAFNSNATILATAGIDQRVGRWRLPDVTLHGKLLRAHTGSAHTIVAFNPTTDQLISSGSDAIILLWPPVDRADEPLPLIGHIQPAYALAFSPDGQYLLAGDGNKQVLLWQVSPQLWRNHACAVVNRNLTADEWRLYVGEGPTEQICP